MNSLGVLEVELPHSQHNHDPAHDARHNHRDFEMPKRANLVGFPAVAAKSKIRKANQRILLSTRQPSGTLVLNTANVVLLKCWSKAFAGDGKLSYKYRKVSTKCTQIESFIN